MGIYDRDYERPGGFGQPPGLRLDGPRTLTTNLVLFTVGVYVLQLVIESSTGWLLLPSDWFYRPWEGYRLLTYGFLHHPGDLKHLIFNMIGLWFFGRAIEQRFGRTEFLVFYLIAIVFAGLVWCVADRFMYGGEFPTSMLGASGGLSAILVLFALNFPKQLIYIWGILPVPAWAFGLFFVGSDVMGAVSRSGDVAYTAHLGGALFGFLYHHFGWRVSNWLPSNFSLPKPPGRSKLRIHDPQGNPEEDHRGNNDDSKTDQRVDEILKKIQAQGQDSLTWRERRALEKASQEYQKKRR